MMTWQDCVVGVDQPERDQGWDASARQETETERLDRNWYSLLQELRVTQTGVQLLTGFLLTLPFQQRFTQLGSTTHVVYLVTVACSIGSTALLIAPVAMHRLLFRRHRLRTLVSTAHRCALGGLALLGAALCGVAVVIFATVSGWAAGWAAGILTAVMLAFCWMALPLFARGRHDKQS